VDSDKGSPFVVEHPDSPAAKAFTGIVNQVEAYLKENMKPEAEEKT
jgi:MinD-like ATPase involved in chromosome partitioning or flagellar assembly